MENINVKKIGDWKFEVVIGKGRDKTSHTVKLEKDYWKNLTNSSIEPFKLVEKSFRFLL